MGKRFALVMGNHAYPEPCRELAEDASEVAGFLRRRPGFETPIFYNKTAEAVTTKLLELVRRLKDAAPFFFHFASRSLAVGNAESRSAPNRDANAALLQNVPGGRELKRQAEAALESSGAMKWSASTRRNAGTRQTLEIGSEEYGFCLIPAGEFDMGSPTSEEEREDDETRHHVELTKGFWMLETPVTQSLYEEVIGSNPSYFKCGNLPVENVSWDEAMDFCAELTKRLPSGLTASLPTEAQWEYACRAGTKTAFSFGNELNGDQANCDGNYPYGTTRTGKYLEETSPVKSYAPNAWGLYDMHGNVREWVLDYYGAYPTGTVVDPKGPDTASYRVMRGGCWFDVAGNCRSASRIWYSPVHRDDDLGFRFLLSCD